MVSYPSLNLTLCPEDEQTHGPGHPSLKESPDRCLEKKRENGCFVSRKWWVLRKKKTYNIKVDTVSTEVAGCIFNLYEQCPVSLC